MNYTKRRKVLICYLPLLALLVSLCVPVMPLKAASWNLDKLKPNVTLAEGDTITCKGIAKITVTYQLIGSSVTAESSDGTLTISSQSESSNGNTYKKYTVTSITQSDNLLEISLTGIPSPAFSLVKLIIETPPEKTEYLEGESFDKKGMVITACYDDDKWKTIDNYKITPSGALTANDTSVTISYTDDGNVTKTAIQKITVTANNSDDNRDSFIISANAAAGGSISDAGGSCVNRWDSKTYTITPYSGYRINYVEVDGTNVGPVSSYTFENVQGDHSISAYFLTGTAAGQNNAAKRKLTVVGSFAAASGAGSYLPGTKVNVDAGFVPGFAFAGWVASDGIIYPLPAMFYVMPSYDVLLYANWVQAGTPNALNPISTTNLKGQQLTNWQDITNRLATFGADDMNQAGSPVMKVAVGGIHCYIDAAPVAMLNTRQGIALDVSYGTDASFTFYSDTDNTGFTGTDLSYTCSTGANFFFREKSLKFAQTGPINTNICVNVSLPDAQAGQIAYVYLVSEKGAEMIYLPAIVDAEKKVSIPISAKVNLSIKY